VTVAQLLGSGLAAVLAGMMGSLLGLGGGLFITPLLTGVLSIDIHLATAASIVGVVATSNTGGASYLRRGLPHIRLALLMETCTVAGAIVGALANGLFSARLLAAAFALVLIYAATTLLRKPQEHRVDADPLAVRLGLTEAFPVRHLATGLSCALLAGLTSGLLGVGGGLILVPAMVSFMGVPIKIATATSTYMIGVTGVAGAAIQLVRGHVDPVLAAPVVLGVFLGASIGPRIAPRLSPAHIRLLFIVAVGLALVQMIAQVVTT
jgi:uncharacterized membrane protein YfcA